MKILKYTAKTKWAGLVWVWGATLNQVPKDGSIKISCGAESSEILYTELKSRIVKTKPLFNKKTGKMDTQYGFKI